jgi:hypothetical protein
LYPATGSVELVGASQTKSTEYVTPVPLSVITELAPVEELLAIDSWPVAAPETVGSNWTLSVAVCPGLSVSGKLNPLAEKPVPVIVAALIVTGAVPEEVRVSD